MVLNEFDQSKKSTFNPDEVETKIPNFPKVGVTCFSQKLINKIVSIFEPSEIAQVKNANGGTPIYKISYKGTEVAFFMSRVGAPACTTSYEEVIAMGLEKLVMFGTCGILCKEIEDLAIIIPNSAVRDEGTSYHYFESSDEISVNEKYKAEFINLLNQHNYSFVEGKTWTTDAPYRETQGKVIKRRNQGCICVEMECSAMSAVAQFRNKDIFTFFYAADNLDNTQWDKRSLSCANKLEEKEKIALLALEFAKQISLD